MANSSLTYEILLYLNSFYFGLLAACEIGMAVLKAINLNYTPQQLQLDGIILVSILVLETVRVYLGRKGCLADRDWQVIVSVVLTVPSLFGVLFLLFLQTARLKLEMILCALMFGLQLTELVYAIIFAFSTCRPVTYT